MRILHISKYAHGGAAIAARRIHLGLLENHVSSFFLSQFPSPENIPNSFVVNQLHRDKPTLPNRVILKFQHRFRSGRPINTTLLAKELPLDVELFSTTAGVLNSSFSAFLQSFDVIHLHWVSDMLDWDSFFKGIKGKKIVWTLHDAEVFTGGCHYFGDCAGYMMSCENCPQLKETHLPALAKKQLNQKANILQSQILNPITCISPSSWLMQKAKNSTLLQRFEHINIPNAIDTNIFKPLPRGEWRSSLQIPDSQKVFLFVSQNIHTTRKGFDLLLDTLKEMDEVSATILVVGKKNLNLDFTTNLRAIELGEIQDENQLAKIYNMADAFILPSREDNLPNTVLESLCCGTPVIAFSMGGVPDMIIDGQNGIICGQPSTTNLKTGIQRFLDSQTFDRGTISKIAAEKYNLQVISEKYLTTYSA